MALVERWLQSLAQATRQPTWFDRNAPGPQQSATPQGIALLDPQRTTPAVDATGASIIQPSHEVAGPPVVPPAARSLWTSRTTVAPPPAVPDQPWLRPLEAVVQGGLDFAQGLYEGQPTSDASGARQVGQQVALGLGLMTPMHVPAISAKSAAATRASWSTLKSALSTGERVSPRALEEYVPELLNRFKTTRASEIVARTKANGGYSVNLMTGEVQPTSGFMVGTHGNWDARTRVVPLEQFSKQHVVDAVKANLDDLARPDRYLGLWVSEGNVYIETSKLVAPEVEGITKPAKLAGAKQHAQRLATKEAELQGRGPTPRVPAQKAIWDNEHSVELPVGNLDDFVNSQEFQDRLDAMYQVGHEQMSGKSWWNLYGGPLERVYGKERVRPLAGFLASTSPSLDPKPNLRLASEYLRRLIAEEPIIQPEFRIPQGSIGYKPGGKMFFEKTKVDNLLKAAAGDLDMLRKDKVNDMAAALVGEARAVIDRRYAKIAEKPKAGVYVAPEHDVVPGSMDGTREAYAIIENAVRKAAERHGVDLSRFSADVWEGIGLTIQRKGELFGTPHRASAIPESSMGFNVLFPRLVAEKASHLGMTVADFEALLRQGKQSLLSVLLVAPALLADRIRNQHMMKSPRPGA